MFCVQCEQTIRTPAGNGCSYAQGMCGKTAETSDLQDLLIASLQGLSAWALKAREYGIIDHEVDSFAPRAFFSTLTNVNFDSPRIVGYARQAIALREALKAQCQNLDASAAVDNPVADLHRSATIWVTCSVRRQTMPQIKIKPPSARIFSVCVCCACTA